MIARDPTIGIKLDLIGLAAREAIAHGVTVSAVLRALVDDEAAPEFSASVDRYLRTRGLVREQVLGFVADLLGGQVGLPELLALGVGYVDHELTAERATELVAWSRRVQQTAARTSRRHHQAVQLAQAAAEQEAEADAAE